ncbi:ribosomal protein S18 acetylase RimI-like enzyme [Terracoccus luteus]|uniref:Ribosomal protein S18 acetylase RimI-like enzyme n=1 Tax=Terracoccus luteus TaxID=53356 RepID=A0A495XWS4_9MICO|nr:GNAT family N-acetyltransferase [Terracoccus luteus]RKT79031.1 ribosomal protein S18 acetylase RimI-like enzyme [Terracoccus luteus]
MTGSGGPGAPGAPGASGEGPGRPDHPAGEVGPLTDADHDRWEALFRDYIAFYGRELPQAAYDRAWREFRSDTVLHALGARVDGELVGITHFLVHANTSGPDVCYLQDLFTSPEARGRGVGRALVEAVAEWARAQGCGRVYWQTAEDNAVARRLYDSLVPFSGFVVYRLPL